MDNQQFPYSPPDPDQGNNSQQEWSGEDASHNEPANQGNDTPQPENQYWQNPADTQADNQSRQTDLPPPDTVSFNDDQTLNQSTEQQPHPPEANTPDPAQDNEPLEVPAIPPDDQFQTPPANEGASQPVDNTVQQPQPPQPPQPEPVESTPQEEPSPQVRSDTQEAPPIPQEQPLPPNEQTQEAQHPPSPEQPSIPQPSAEEQNVEAPQAAAEPPYGQEASIPDQPAQEPPQENVDDSPQIYTFKRRGTTKPVTDTEEQTSQEATHPGLQGPYTSQQPAAENLPGNTPHPEPVQPEEQQPQTPQQQLPPESTQDTPVPAPASSGQPPSEQPVEMPSASPLTTETDQQQSATPAEQGQQDTVQQFPQHQKTSENAEQQSGQQTGAANDSNNEAPANTAATFPLPNNQAQPATADQSEPLQATPPEQPETASGQSEKDNTIASKALDALGKIKKVNFKPAVSAALTGILILGIFNSQAILGQVQYLTTPSGGRAAPSGSIDANTPVGDESRILIPQLDVNVPVVYDEKSFEEEKVQKALERGVVHYGTTAMPGENGNNVIVGHSSNNWWDSGKYKFAFILLDKLQNGDEIILHYEGTRYVYEVHNKEVVEPTNTDVLKQTEDPILTLITCTPPGTSWKRLIVQAEQVTPDPSQNTEPGTLPSENAEALPSDSGRSLFEVIGDLF